MPQPVALEQSSSHVPFRWGCLPSLVTALVSRFSPHFFVLLHALCSLGSSFQLSKRGQRPKLNPGVSATLKMATLMASTVSLQMASDLHLSSDLSPKYYSLTYWLQLPTIQVTMDKSLPILGCHRCTWKIQGNGLAGLFCTYTPIIGDSMIFKCLHSYIDELYPLKIIMLKVKLIIGP